MRSMLSPERPPVARCVGGTPLVEMTRTNPHREQGVRILAKLEGSNPGGSVKARPALYMVEAGIHSGELTAERGLIDATSGNTGIAYAVLGAAWGFPVTLCMPENASDERKRILRAHGAELVLTDPLEGQDGAIERCRELVAEDPARYHYPDQYSNPANPLSHYETTGPEVWEQTDGEVTHLVVGLGTTGTAVGTARYLREQRPDIVVAGVEPASPMHGLEGLKHLETSKVPGIFEPKVLDRRLTVATDAAYEATRRLARAEGLFVGQSSGAALAASLELAEELEDATIVTVYPDGGDKYLTTSLWQER